MDHNRTFTGIENINNNILGDNLDSNINKKYEIKKESGEYFLKINKEFHKVIFSAKKGITNGVSIGGGSGKHQRPIVLCDWNNDMNTIYNGAMQWIIEKNKNPSSTISEFFKEHMKKFSSPKNKIIINDTKSYLGDYFHEKVDLNSNLKLLADYVNYHIGPISTSKYLSDIKNKNFNYYGKKEDNIVSLSDFLVNQKGVCLHGSLATAMIMEKQGLEPIVHRFRIMGACHQICILSEQYKLHIIDVMGEEGHRYELIKNDIDSFKKDYLKLYD